MKNILMISPVIPSDSGFGIQKRAAFHLKNLSKTCNIHLVVFNDRLDEDKISEALENCCRSYKIVAAIRKERVIFSRLPPFAIISELIVPNHEAVIPNKETLLDSILHLENIKIDIVFCFRIRAAIIFDQLKKQTSLKAGRKIVDFDDIESIVSERAKIFNTVSLGFEQTLIDKIRLYRGKKVENRFLRDFDDVLICSLSDKEFLERTRRPSANIHVIANSTSLPTLTIAKPKKNKKLNILFVGTMSYGPNEDGILWFCDEILPLIREETKIGLSLYVVGFNPPQTVHDLEKIKDVTVTGGVDSVVPYYQESDIVIAPIRYGGGTRIKILEAMGFQKPVVSTTIGAEGINITHGQNILIADTPEEFALSCVELMENDACRQTISIKARKCIEEKYTDIVIGQKLRQIIGQ